MEGRGGAGRRHFPCRSSSSSLVGLGREASAVEYLPGGEAAKDAAAWSVCKAGCGGQSLVVQDPCAGESGGAQWADVGTCGHPERHTPFPLLHPGDTEPSSTSAGATRGSAGLVPAPASQVVGVRRGWRSCFQLGVFLPGHDPAASDPRGNKRVYSCRFSTSPWC